ncbi:hypothetical protein SFRURICE_018093 [Spodoptera frugiperda]|nr:hypothetical protein SFRURICE_018093 [Spodoptera frugiperda]
MTRCENTNKANKYCGIGNATIYHFTAQSRAAPRPPCGGITEIAKRLNAIIAQILPFLSQEHQQQVASAVERAKQQQRPDLPRLLQQMHAAHLPAHGAPPLPLLGQGALPPAGLLGLGVPHHPLSVLAKPPDLHRPDDKGNGISSAEERHVSIE